MSQINIQFYTSKIGDLIIGAFENKLCLLDFRYRKMRKAVDDRIKRGLKTDFVAREDEVIKQTKQQLDEYLIGERKQFTIPMLLIGTDFQKAVWESLIKVPYGSTATYMQLAKDIHSEKAVRAVASANGANAIALLVPCHRIIGSDGQLVGYGGGLKVKQRLLNLEKPKVFVGVQGELDI